MPIELDSSLLHIARDLAAAWSANPTLGLQHYDYFDQTLQNANIYANRCKYDLGVDDGLWPRLSLR